MYEYVTNILHYIWRTDTACPLPHSPPSYASYDRVGDIHHRNSWQRPCCCPA